MKLWTYAPKYRPPGFATCPAGWILVERDAADRVAPLRTDVPRGERTFGLIGYERPLEAQQIEAYELVAIDRGEPGGDARPCRND